MALKKLFDEGGNLSYGSPVTGPAPTITSVPSQKVKGQGKKCFFGTLNFTIPSGVTNGSCTTTAPFSGSINPSAVKTKSGGQAAVLDGDNVVLPSVPGQTGSSSPCTFSITVTTNASQSKVKGQ